MKGFPKWFESASPEKRKLWEALDHLINKALRNGEISKQEHEGLQKAIDPVQHISKEQVEFEKEGARVGKKYHWHANFTTRMEGQMNQRDLQRIVGQLLVAGFDEQACDLIALSSKHVPRADAPPAGVSPQAARWWKTHVYPKYKKAILKGGWPAAVWILRRSCEKHDIPMYGK